MVRDNLPELTLEEKMLVKMETMDIPKDRAGQALVDGKASEFKMLEAQKKKVAKGTMGQDRQPKSS